MLPIIFRGHEEAGFFARAVRLRIGPSPIVVLPGNQRTAEVRYACLIVVKDYFRLGSASRPAGRWHYSSIEPAILADVRAGRAVLVFDLSNEGPAYDPTIFSELYGWLELNQVPAGRCILLTQNRMMGSAAVADVGPRAGLIQFDHYDYFVKLMAWKFSLTHTGETIGVDPESYPAQLLSVARKDRLLLCLNATPRLSRALAVAALQHHLLLNRSLVSFPGMNYVKSGASLGEVVSFIDHNPRLEYLRRWAHAVSRMAPLLVDGFNEKGNDLVEKIDRMAYERTFFSLVTESDFAEQGIARVTEKTVKAFCMGHPTLILGNTHSIDIMRSFGFQDWSDVLDRNAESMAIPAARFELVFAEVQRQVQRIRANPTSWIGAVSDVSIRNHHYAVSGQFLSHYVGAFDEPLLTRMATLIAS